MIYADENVWVPVAEGLERRGWEVTTALEEGTLGFSDAEHIEYAAEHGWTILAFDDDFLSLADATAAHPGIVFIPQHGRTVGELVQRIDATLQHHRDQDLHRTIVFA
ncbi:DUF5615 family PIN-like protein [Halovivax gelatinilyticus]|uniref:DUF5615 family PIN-like protein n=1 Tax=Halovivax gelatinilyticus TaxID=2961597 RepID=UPI0020CA47F9|nr:DUF5615 family PIN-like protein [Halovivax gelatinilyticus]